MKYDKILQEMDLMAEFQKEAMRVSLGDCQICYLSVTLWDSEYGDMGSHYVGESIYHEACLDGRMAVAG